MLQQLILQLLIVFDDAVMNTNNLRFNLTGTRTCAVAGNMRMRIGDAGLSMRCPAGVTDTAGTNQCIAAIRLFDEV